MIIVSVMNNKETSNNIIDHPHQNLVTLLSQLDDSVYGYTIGSHNSTNMSDTNYFWINSKNINEIINFHEFTNSRDLTGLKYDIIKSIQITNLNSVKHEIPVFEFETILGKRNCIDINHIIAVLCNGTDLHFDVYCKFAWLNVLSNTIFVGYMRDNITVCCDKNNNLTSSTIYTRSFLRVFVTSDAISKISNLIKEYIQPSPSSHSIIRRSDNFKDTRIKLYKLEKIFDESVNELYSFSTKITRSIYDVVSINTMFQNNKFNLEFDNCAYGIDASNPTSIINHDNILHNKHNVGPKYKSISNIDEHEIVSYKVAFNDQEHYDICHVLGLYLLDTEFLGSENSIHDLCKQFAHVVYTECHRDLLKFQKCKYNNMKQNLEIKKYDGPQSVVRYLIAKSGIPDLLKVIKKINFMKRINDIQNLNIEKKYNTVSAVCLDRDNLNLINSLQDVMRLYRVFFDRTIIENHKILMQEIIYQRQLKIEKYHDALMRDLLLHHQIKSYKNTTRENMKRCLSEITEREKMKTLSETSEPKKSISDKLSPEKILKLRELIKQLEDIYTEYQNYNKI